VVVVGTIAGAGPGAATKLVVGGGLATPARVALPLLLLLLLLLIELLALWGTSWNCIWDCSCGTTTP